MSHFSSVKTQLISKEALVQGLQNLLAAKGMKATVEVHDKPVLLISDYSRSDQAYAEVVIRRSDLHVTGRNALLDVGFLWNDYSQQFEIQVDPWDFDQNALGIAFNGTQIKEKTLSNVQNFLDEVQFAHDKAYIEINYPPHLWDYSEVTNSDGSVETLLTQKVDIFSESVSVGLY